MLGPLPSSGRIRFRVLFVRSSINPAACLLLKLGRFQYSAFVVRSAPATTKTKFFTFDSFLPGLLLRGFLLLCASSFEYVFHGVISLVTRVLIYRPWRLRQGNLTLPRARKRSRVFDCELIKDRVCVRTRKALDEMQVSIAVVEVPLVGEIGGIDHKCVPLPMASRVTQQLPDVFWKMRAPL